MAAPISAEEVAHRAASDAELIAWVDEQDRPLGSLPRAELRERGLIGRGTFILLFNSAGELCVQRRTLSKAVYPGYWDLAAGGMVQAGEPYADSAARELEEELGIRDAVLRGTWPLLLRRTGQPALVRGVFRRLRCALAPAGGGNFRSTLHPSRTGAGRGSQPAVLPRFPASVAPVPGCLSRGCRHFTDQWRIFALSICSQCC